MLQNSFFAISTGCLKNHPENTRSRFTNDFPKPAVTSIFNKDFFICLDQINFEQSFTSYEKSTPFDFAIYRENVKQYQGFSYKNSVFTFRDLIFASDEIQNTLPTRLFKFENINGRARIFIEEDLIVFHLKFWTFLKLPPRENDNGYVKVFKGEILVSSEQVHLNDSIPKYINIHCNEVTSYPFNNSFTTAFAQIPLLHYNGHLATHFDTVSRQYFKISNDRITSLTFELRHPNGLPIYLKKGPPTIIKATIAEMGDEVEFFHIQASSVKTYPHIENTNHRFLITLPKEQILDGKWCVALTNLYLPGNKEIFFREDYKTYYFPNEEDRTFIFFYAPADEQKFSPVSTRIEDNLFDYKLYMEGSEHVTMYTYGKTRFTRKELIKDLAYQLHAYVDVTVDADENFVFNTKAQFYSDQRGGEISKESKLYFYLNPVFYNVLFKNPAASRVIKNTIATLSQIHPNLQNKISKFKEVDKMITGCLLPKFENHNSLTEENTLFGLFSLEEYYYEYPQKNVDDVPQFHQKENNEEEETRNRKKNQKSAIENTRLIEIYKKKKEIKEEIEEVKEVNPAWMFLYCDFVHPTVIADNYNNLLKLVPYKDHHVNGKSGGFYSFPSLDFFDINKTHLNTLEFIIKTHSGSNYEFFKDEHVTLTLLFKRK